MSRTECRSRRINGEESPEIIRIVPSLSRRPTSVSTLLWQLRSEPLCITGKQRAVRIFGLSVFPEMRLTVSFRITYTLRPVWGAGTVSEDFLLFSFHSELHDRYHSRTFRRRIEIVETPRRD